MQNDNLILVYESYHYGARIRYYKVGADSIPEFLNGENKFHIYHVKLLTELILRQLRDTHEAFALSEEEIEAISIASCLHDIGKIEIPNELYEALEDLTQEEYDILRMHTICGAELIEEAETSGVDPRIIQYACKIAREHHERFDGSGYPDGLKGDEISLAAQVVSLADAYDTLTSKGSYKEAYSQYVAMQMITSDMCGTFDQRLVDALFCIVNHYKLSELRAAFHKNSPANISHTAIHMKHVLCVGNTAYLNKRFVAETFHQCNIIVLGNEQLQDDEQISSIHIIKNPSLKALFDTYVFDVILYFSDQVSYQLAKQGSAAELLEVLELAKQADNHPKILFLSSLDSIKNQSSARAILAKANESLCEYYRTTGQLDLKLLQIPYLYSACVKEDFLYKIFRQLDAEKYLQLEETPTNPLVFLSLYDLSDLITRVVQNWESEQNTFIVGDGFCSTFYDLKNQLSILFPDAQIRFANNKIIYDTAIESEILKNDYGWFSKLSILEELDEQYQQYLAWNGNTAKVETQKKKPLLWGFDALFRDSRRNEQLEVLINEKKELEEQLFFLQKLNHDLASEKQTFRKQIVNLKYSFGKIFDVTRSVAIVEPYSLYLQIFETFEALLKNKSIAIYLVNPKTAYCRLEAASSEIRPRLARSVSMDMYPELFSEISSEMCWSNTEKKEGYPMFASGVYRDGSLILLILLWEAGEEQNSVYYKNLFEVLCDMAQMSLLYAYDFNRAVYAKQLIPGTHIMKTDAFNECLANIKYLAEKEMSSYLLLQIVHKGCTLAQADALISKRIRANDILGEGEKGTLRLLLSQATREHFPLIAKRFADLGFEISVIE